MNLFARLAASLLDPLENQGQFIARCEDILQRALCLPTFEQNTDKFPHDALCLCICAHLSRMSIRTVHRAYAEIDCSNGGDKLPMDELSTTWGNEWEQVSESLGLNKSKAANDFRGDRPLFSNHKILFVPSLLFSERNARLLLTKVKENGGQAFVCLKGEKGLKEAKDTMATESSSSLTILVCADPSLISKYAHAYDLQYRTPKWLRDCMRDLRLKDPSLYVKSGNSGTNTAAESFSKHSSKRGITGGAQVTAKKRQRTSPTITTDSTGPNTTHPQGFSEEQRTNSWACEVRTSFSRTDFPMNEKICELLGVIMEACQARKEQFRAIGYQKAISKISALKHEVTTLADVRELSAGRGVGDKIEAKIMEIVATGRLRQAEAVLENAENAAVKELCQVWGIGPAKALNLMSHGIKSVRDLRAAVESDPTILDKNQKIGLKHYEDLLLRIPRRHVAELENFVRMMAKSIDQSLDITVAGSYLRGKKDCGDVDILVRGSVVQLERGFPKLIDVLRRKGVLADDLVIAERKYFGIFRFPGRPHGRVDLFAVPEHEYPFALLTYTGSAIFNRQVASNGLKSVLVYM